MPPKQDEDDPAMEYLMISQAAKEFGISRDSLKVWIWSGQIPAKKELSDIGLEYYLVRRGDVATFLANRPNRGRKIKRQKPNA